MHWLLCPAMAGSLALVTQEVAAAKKGCWVVERPCTSQDHWTGLAAAVAAVAEPLVPGLPPGCLGILWRQQMELQKRLGQCLEALRKGLLLLG